MQQKTEDKQNESEETEKKAMYLAWRRFMYIPKHIGVNNIQATIFGFLYEVFPHLHLCSYCFIRTRKRWKISTR